MGNRDMPENAQFYAWGKFNEWADANGVGEMEEDWLPWWDCWKQGYIAAVNE